MSSQYGRIYYIKPNLREKPLFSDRFPIPALQEETTAPPSNYNLAVKWNIVDVLFSYATGSRDKLSGSSWSFPVRGFAWRHRSNTQRTIVPHIYKRCPGISRITWNKAEWAQDNQTIHIRKVSHHCWPRSTSVGWYDADEENSENRSLKFSDYNSQKNLRQRYSFVRIPRLTSATCPTALAHIFGYFCFYSRKFVSFLSVFAPIPAQNTLLPSQDRHTIKHCITTRPRAATTNSRNIRRELKAIHCLHVLYL